MRLLGEDNFSSTIRHFDTGIAIVLIYILSGVGYRASALLLVPAQRLMRSPGGVVMSIHHVFAAAPPVWLA